jgi:subtilisin family serine protease
MRSLLVLSVVLGLACVDPYSAVGGVPNVEKPLVIAVIDTGFGFNEASKSARLCKYGHKDFSISRQFTKDFGTVDLVPKDTNGHGTNVVGLIERSLVGRTDYCIVIVKAYGDSQTTSQNIGATIRAFAYVANIKAKLTNLSAGGSHYDSYEYKAVIRYLNQGGTLVSAAGNENQNTDDAANRFYPAQYDKRIVVVGNKKISTERFKKISFENSPWGDTFERVKSSNWGSDIDRWEVGYEQSGYGIVMTGTSQAAAVATGKIALEMLNVGN